jgi:hypothetical protein
VGRDQPARRHGTLLIAPEAVENVEDVFSEELIVDRLSSMSTSQAVRRALDVGPQLRCRALDVALELVRTLSRSCLVARVGRICSTRSR